MTVNIAQTRTEVGNYFVSNYPPFSQWKPEFVPHALEALNQPPRVDDPLGLYIHIPFCQAICSYCNFNRGLLDESLRRRYVDALEQEIRRSSGGAADTIFFGGGTPSLLEPAEVARLITACRDTFDLTSATNASSSGSGPSPARALLARLRSSYNHIDPNRRGSLNTMVAPLDMLKTT